MPELPEVEMMAQFLSENIDKRVLPVQDVVVHRGKYLPGDEGRRLMEEGFGIFDVRRRGKYLLFRMAKGYLVCHNAMSGYWDFENISWTFDYVEGKREANERDVRVTLVTPNQKIRFHDSRLFGSLRYYPDVKFAEEIPPLAKLGPEATLIGEVIPTKAWTAKSLLDWCEKRKEHEIKRLLMEQDVVAGLGNIYATEILWHCQIDPRRKAKDINEKQASRIVRTTESLLKHALDCEVKYDEYLQVYRRKMCRRCRGEISKVKLSGRSTYFCPNCQH